MHIAFYTPFKPLGHQHPSGDLVIATGLYDFLTSKGHSIWQVGPLRARWIYWKPWLLVSLLKIYQTSKRQALRHEVNLWLTYHTYYKAPDMLGPKVSRAMEIPYVIFQGIYSTKRKRDPKTWPGYVLNKTALESAQHIFSNRREDWVNLKRLVPEERLTYVKPGILTETFQFDAQARIEQRRAWDLGEEPVILSAAMFRSDVKTEGLAFLIQSCGRLARKGISFKLVIAGDGKERQQLQELANQHLPDNVLFVGKIAREEMFRFYSAGDLFVFPGIRESLGMVYLESQSCGLPIIAFNNGGIPEVVVDGQTGILTPLYEAGFFEDAIQKLVQDSEMRQEMGKNARHYVHTHHHLFKNYVALETVLKNIIRDINNA